MEIFRSAIKPVVNGLVILLFMGCTSQRIFERFDNWEKIEQKNCGSFNQRGRGWLKEGEKSYIQGKVWTCYDNKVAAQANILLVNVWGDTVVNVLANDKGEFHAKLPNIIFRGKIIAKSLGSELTIENIYLNSFKYNRFDMKLPTIFMHINHDAHTKEGRRVRKILMKQQKAMEKEKKK